MSEVAEVVESAEAAPAASPAASPAPAPQAPAASPAAEPAAAPAVADKSAWRDGIIAELFGEATDDEPADTKAEREKMGKMLGRYTTPGAAMKALRDAQHKLGEKVASTKLPKDATPEQIAEWRQANGIPDTPDKYELGLPDGVVLGDADKSLLDEWVKEVHGVNAPPEVVMAGASALVKLRDAQVVALAEKDKEQRQALEVELAEEWGMADFHANRQGILNMLGQADASVKDTILNARGPDGSAIANNPAVMRWLAQHAREAGFVGATVVPSGGDVGKGVEDAIAELEAKMFDKDGKRVIFSDKDQARYSQLLEARARHAK